MKQKTFNIDTGAIFFNVEGDSYNKVESIFWNILEMQRRIILYAVQHSIFTAYLPSYFEKTLWWLISLHVKSLPSISLIIFYLSDRDITIMTPSS